MVKLLLFNDANIEAKDSSQWTPLHMAAFNGHIDTIKLLLFKGANIKAKINSQWTPLNIAAINGHRDLEELLHSKPYCLT